MTPELKAYQDAVAECDRLLADKTTPRDAANAAIRREADALEEFRRLNAPARVLP